jgi:hypothetical protein
MRRHLARQNASSARQDGSSASTPYQANPITKRHMKNDNLIIGFIFEPSDEGIKYMKHIKNVIQH